MILYFIIENILRFKKGAVPVGLLCYPLLQAADVLLYKATHIPVGEDQNQHLNIIRHMAYMFNLTFKCDYFPMPEKVTFLFKVITLLE